jgi:hypothetical protein
MTGRKAHRNPNRACALRRRRPFAGRKRQRGNRHQMIGA